MKKFIKITLAVIAVIAILLYLAFLFILPNAIDLNRYKMGLSEIVKRQTNLSINFSDAKISVTPLLSAGVIVDNTDIQLPDESSLIFAEKLKLRISLPHLLLLKVKVTSAEIIKPSVNIDIVDGKAYKAVQVYEEVLNIQEQNIEQTVQATEKPIIDPAKIKIYIPNLHITDYSVAINDLKTKNSLKLIGDDLKLSYNNGKKLKIKTIAELYVNNRKNITANINVDTFIPEQTTLDEEDDKAQRVDIPFVNPVSMYMAYDLKTNIDSKIKIRNKNNKIKSYGYFNIDNFTLNIAGTQLPESKFHLNSKGTKIKLDTDLYILDNEKLSLLGLLNYDKNPSIDLNIKSTQIHTQNILNLVKAVIDSLHIKNDLKDISGEGYISIDTYIKTNFKKLKSSGNITIKDLIVKNTQKKQQLVKLNSIISLDDSILKFKNTILEAAETLFKIDGSINEKSYTDISVLMEKMPLKKVFDMFMPTEINEAYSINSGYINLNANIKGELKNAIGKLKISLNNLSILDKINNINYLNNIITADFNSDFKTYTGNISNSDFKLIVNGTSVYCEKFNLIIGEKDITIPNSIIKLNNNSTININGDIKNYIKNPIFSLNAEGKLKTQDLKSFLGKDMEIFIKNKGEIPVLLSLNGNNKKQTLNASIEANAGNYITPIDLSNVSGKNTILQTVIDFKGDRLKIKDTGFYIKNIIKDPEKPEKVTTKLEEVFGLEGTITKLNTSNPNINLIKLRIPNNIDGTICAFPKSKLYSNGHLYIFGNLNSPRLRGDFKIWDLSIPELLLAIKDAEAKFEGKDLNIDIKYIIANGSDYNIFIKADLNPSSDFIIKHLNLSSVLSDADKLMQISDAAMKYFPASSSSQTPASNNSTSADIPVIINDGNIDIKTIKTGAIELTNTSGKLSLAKNVLYINNLVTSGFKGKITGNVSTNLITSEIKTKLKGTNLDAEKTLLDAAAMKDTLTGTMDFDTDISLQGATYEEQMKSLKGNVNFQIKNGQLGPFGKIENLILAENIRESAFFKSTIGTILNSLLSFDTTHYNLLTGSLSFNDGITQINPITTSGDIMSTYIFGDFDLLNNKIDIKLRGKLGSQISESMGPLALLNPINLVKATPGMSLVLGKIFFLFTEVVNDTELAQIPDLGKNISDNNSTKFQVVVKGDVAKPLTLVKSFKWLALSSDMENAKKFLNSIPDDTIPIDLSNLNTENIKTEVKKQAKKKIEKVVSDNVSDETIQNIEQTKETASKLKSLFGTKEKAKETLKKQAEQAILELTKSSEEQEKEQQ